MASTQVRSLDPNYQPLTSDKPLKASEARKRDESPEKRPKQLTTVSDEEVTSVFKTLTTYTLLIIFLPISSYFVAKKYIFEQYFGLDSSQSFIYWAIFAVASIHVVLGIMVYGAYREGVKPRSVKQD